MISLLFLNLVPLSKKLKYLVCRCSTTVSCQEVYESIVLYFSCLYFVNFPHTINMLYIKKKIEIYSSREKRELMKNLLIHLNHHHKFEMCIQ